VLVLMELGEQQVLGFLDSHIYCNPSLVIGMNDSRIMDTEVCEPCFDICYSLVFRCEGIVDFLWTPVLAVVL
jgi:hypothetical protein